MRQGFPYRKATQALNFFALKENGSISKIKALKLVWLAERYHLRQYGRPILNDAYFALPFGPVASNTKNLAEASEFLPDSEQGYRDACLDVSVKNTIRSLKPFEKEPFSTTDIEAMEKAYEAFGAMKPMELSDVSHRYPEWKRYESDLKNGPYSRFAMSYADFFLDPEMANAAVFAEQKDVLDSSRELFEEYRQP